MTHQSQYQQADKSSESLLFDQLQWLYEQSYSSILTSLLFVAILLSVFWTAVAHSVLFLWVAAMIVVSTLRLLLVYRYQQREKYANLMIWQNLFTLGTIAAAMVWGAAGYFLFVPGSLAHQVFLVFVLGSVSAIAVSSLAVYLRIFLIFFLINLIPVTLMLITGGENFQTTISMMLILFVITQYVSARRFHDNFHEAIAVRYENTALIANLSVAKNRAEAANRTKSTFLSTMSHELRTPLNSVIGFSNLLVKNRKQHLDDKELTLVKRIQANGKHLLKVINDILDLSKIEAYRMEVERERVDLPQLIGNVVDQLQGQVLDKDITLIADIPDEVEGILSDGGKLRHILINLVGNAIKFTKQGKVVVRLFVNEQTRQPERIDVVDSGVGIAKHRQQAVFEPFSQADGSITRQYGGTGLGLSISRAMAGLLDCSLQVKSQEGVGSTFSLVFHSPESGSSDELEAYHELSLVISHEELIKEISGKRILLIESDRDVRDIFHQYLEGFDCHFIDTDNGPEAIALIISEKPNLIILDLNLPTMNGWEVLLRIRNSPNLNDIPVLVVSESAADHGMVLGSIISLPLPLTCDDLLRGVYQCLCMTRRQYTPRVLMVGNAQKSFTEVVHVLEVDRTDIRLSLEVEHIEALISDFLPDLLLLDGALLAGKSKDEKLNIIRSIKTSGATVAIMVDEDLLATHMEGLNVEEVEMVLTSKNFRKQLKDLVRQACQAKTIQKKQATS